MASVNRVIILGNMGQDIEVRMTQSGKTVGNISVCTNESWTQQDGTKQERAEWHKVVIYGQSAEYLAKYAQKGTTVYVEGKIQTRSWDDANGQKRYSTEIIAEDVKIVSGGRQNQQEPSAPANHNSLPGRQPAQQQQAPRQQYAPQQQQQYAPRQQQQRPQPRPQPQQAPVAQEFTEDDVPF